MKHPVDAVAGVLLVIVSAGLAHTTGSFDPGGIYGFFDFWLAMASVASGLCGIGLLIRSFTKMR